MKLSPISSSFIDAIGYDPDTRTLGVLIRGTEYTYPDVSPETYNQIVNAPSIGRAFNDFRATQDKIHD